MATEQGALQTNKPADMSEPSGAEDAAEARTRRPGDMPDASEFQGDRTRPPGPSPQELAAEAPTHRPGLPDASEFQGDRTRPPGPSPQEVAAEAGTRPPEGMPDSSEFMGAQTRVGGPSSEDPAEARTRREDGVDPVFAPTVISETGGSAARDRRASESSGWLPSSRKGALRKSGRLGVASDEGELFDDKYELLGEIARGGMGVVYKANQVDLDRVVALKVMLSGALASEEDKRRFIREANASARLQHPNIVPVYDIGEVEGNLYFTMDYVEGSPLSDRKKDLDRAALLEIMIQVTDGVSYAHQRMIIHRDLKPANIMLNGANEPLIMDFGLAKQVALTDETGQASLRTREGSVMGTPHYMPPEQAEGLISEIDVRSDVYALGVILYELWAGRLPFEGRTMGELMLKILDEDPTPPRQFDPTIDWDIEAIILKALEKEKEKRYQTAADLKRDLERTRDGLTILARRATLFYRGRKWSRRNRRGLGITGLVVVMAVGSASYAMYTGGESRRLATARFRTQLAASAATQADLAAERTALASQVVAFWADPGELGAARRDHRRTLAGQVEDLRAQLEGAAGALRPYVAEREEAGDATGADEASRTITPLVAGKAVLTHAGEALATVERIHDDLAAADEKLAQAGALADEVDRQLASDDERSELPASATLAEAQVSFEELLARSRDSAAGSGAGDVAAAADFAAVAAEIEQQAFTAIGGVGQAGQRFREVLPSAAGAVQGAPELAEAQQVHESVVSLRGRVETALQQARRIRLAATMDACGARVLELLAEEETANVDVVARLGAARLAQALVQRGLEAAESEALGSTRHDANRVYAELLLEMKAYLVLEAELRSKDAFRPGDLVELRRQKTEALAATAQLERELGEDADPASLGVAQLEARVERLRSLEGDAALNVELEGLRLAALQRVQAALVLKRRVLAQQRVKQARERAEAAPTDLSVPARVRSELAKALARWTTVEGALNERRADLEPREYAEGVRGCEIKRAELYQAAADATERANPKFALGCVRLAARRFATLRETPDAVPHVAPTALEVAETLLATLVRRTERPEGMALLDRRVDANLGGGALDRNEPRSLTVGPLYLALHEVTNAEYSSFVRSPKYRAAAFWAGLEIAMEHVGRWPEGWSGRQPPEGLEGLPVVGVNWYEARGYAAFCEKRLPTDAEWEYAARYQGGEPLRFPWGDEWRPGLLQGALRPPGANSQDETAVHGLCDMAGNVSEWVVLRQGGEDAPAVRGASYLYPTERFARAAHRLLAPPTYRGPQLGIRLAKESQ